MSEMIGLDAIKKGAQARARMKKEAIEDYARAMREGAQFPPIMVFRDGKDYWLADGFHRVEAARCAEREEIEADIQEGNRRDALLYACGANTVHGLPRTNADKRKAVTLLLQDEAWHELPSREIARHCCVDEGLVRKIREELSADCPQINPETRVVTRGGTTYKQRKPSKSKDVTAQPEAERPLPSEPATPTMAEHDGFAALQTAWQGANQDGRRRFVVWARGNDPGAFEDASAPAADAPRDTDVPAITPAPASGENAPQPEPAPEGNGAEIEPAPAINGGATRPLLSPNAIDGMGIDDMLRFVREHSIDIPRFDHLTKPQQQAALKDYMARAGAEQRNAA